MWLDQVILNTASGINPEILAWAREQMGYSVEEVAERMNKDPVKIKSWENGESAPTYSQLERLAGVLYKRPVALFFFPEPPEELTPGGSFRTLPEPEVEKLLPDTRLKLREALSFQLSLMELNDGVNTSERKIFRDVEVVGTSPAEARRVALLVIAYLDVGVEARSKSRTTTEWFKWCRTAVEDAGVYVFKNSFKQKDISGLCIYHEQFPIIHINNSTTSSRQVFTLFHELAHILVHTNGITQVDDSFIGTLTDSDRELEQFCNKFAAEVLVPRDHFKSRVGNSTPDEQSMSKLANEYKVSREVILRHFLDLDKVSQERYDELVQRWNDEFEAQTTGLGKEGNYYNTQMSYLGDKYLDLAFSRYHQGAIGEEKLAEVLGIKAQSLPKLEQKYFNRLTS